MATHAMDRIAIRADPDLIFRLVAEVEFWPAILPAYRSVRVLRRRGALRLVSMTIWCGAFPVRCTAIQWLDPIARLIRFRHVKGLTRGLDVEWRIAQRAAGTVDVTVEHRLELRRPGFGTFAAERVIGPLIVDDLTGKVLRCIKDIAEGGSLAGRC